MTPSDYCRCLVLDIAGAVILAFGLVLKTPEAALEESTPRDAPRAVQPGPRMGRSDDFSLAGVAEVENAEAL